MKQDTLKKEILEKEGRMRIVEKILKGKKMEDYKHKFSLRIGEIIKVNGVPCAYLGQGNFGTNTYPGQPFSVKRNKQKKVK